MPLPALHHHKTFLHLVAFETMRFFAASPCKLHLGVVAFSFQGDCERIRVCQHVPLMWQASTGLLGFCSTQQTCFLDSDNHVFYTVNKTCLSPQRMPTTRSLSLSRRPVPSCVTTHDWNCQSLWNN